MTLREMLETIGIDDCPMECAFCIASVIRSAVQGEPSTFEGECASLVKLHELTGWRADSPDDIRKWLDDLGGLPDLDVPDSFWLQIAEADREGDDE